MIGQCIDHLRQRPDLGRAQFLQAQRRVGVDHYQGLLAQAQRGQRIGPVQGPNQQAQPGPGQQDDEYGQRVALAHDGQHGLALGVLHVGPQHRAKNAKQHDQQAVEAAESDGEPDAVIHGG